MGTKGPHIRVPLEEGRVDDADYLTPAERALVTFLSDHLSDARLRLVVEELLSIELFRVAVMEALTEDE